MKGISLLWLLLIRKVGLAPSSRLVGRWLVVHLARLRADTFDVLSIYDWEADRQDGSSRRVQSRSADQLSSCSRLRLLLVSL